MTYFQNRLDGGVSNRLELDRIQALPARRPPRRFPTIEQQIAIVENADVAAARAGRRAPIARDAWPPTNAAAGDSGRPAGVAARAAARRRRRPSRCSSRPTPTSAPPRRCSIPTISLTGFLGGVSGDLTTFLGGDGARLVARRRSAAADLPGAAASSRNLEAAQARFDAALAEYQKAALNGYREVANALVTIQKLARGARCSASAASTALQDASDLAALALRLRPRQLHRDPDRRSGSLPAAAAAGADARRRAAGTRRTLPRARRRLAAVAEDNDTDGRRSKKLKSKQYEKELTQAAGASCACCRIGSRQKGLRVIVIFEGRDAAGKGGTIKAITERVSPRVFRLVALPAPSDREKSQMYMQRYMQHFPAAGEIVIFDRSWYNRAGVERVMGFCTDEQYEAFPRDLPEVREVHRRRRHHPDQVLARGQQQGAGAAVQGAHRRSAAAVEAEPDGSAVARQVVRVLARARRDAQGDRHAASRPGTSSGPTTRSARG